MKHLKLFEETTNTDEYHLILKIEKEMTRLRKISDNLRTKYNKETRYGENWTRKGQELEEDRYTINDILSVLDRTISQLKQYERIFPKI